MIKPFVAVSVIVIFVLALSIACLPGSGDEDDRLSSRDRRETREARAERDQLRTERAEVRQAQRAGSGVLPIFGGAVEAEPTAVPAATAAPAIAATSIAKPPDPTATFVPAATAAPAIAAPTAAPFQPQRTQELGGFLTIAVNSPPQRSVRSWMMDTGSANALVHPFAEPLLHTDRFDGSIVPGLSTGWELSDGGDCWLFHLRPGVSFHRGWGEFTSQDVIHSTSLLVRDDALDFGIPTFRELFGQTQGELRRNIGPIDDYTVEFCSSRPADVAQIVSAQTGNFFIYSKTQWEIQGPAGYAELPVGTGPWQLEKPILEYAASASATEYSRVPNHWRQSPLWSRMGMYDIPESTTRLALILAGEASIAELPRVFHSQAADSGLIILESQLLSIQVGLSMGGIYSPSSPYHSRSEPHLDVRVREAINRAIDREHINEVLFNGIGRTSPVWGYHPAQPGWNPRWTREFDSRYGYDPERAHQLLQESGHIGYSLKVIVTQLPDVPEMRDIASVAAESLGDIGIDVHTDEMPWSRYGNYFLTPGQTHGTIAPIRSSIGPILNALSRNNYTDGGLFRTVPDRRLDQLYLQAVNSRDVLNVQHHALRQAGDIKFDQYAEVPLLWLPSQVVVNPDQIGEFVWPGNIIAPFSHTEYIRPALSR